MKQSSEIIPCQPPTHKSFKDFTGQTFGRLTVVELVGKMFSPSGQSRYMFRCKCSCGKETVVRGSALAEGNTTSCGCYGLEAAITASTTHGLTGAPEHTVWFLMRRRCEIPSEPAFKNYGGRGIKVCERWLGEDGFANFYADMGPRPTPKHTIDRINNDGDYEPGNCRWATRKEQCRNRRITWCLTHNGETKPVTAWVEQTNIAYATIRQRIKLGWSAAMALTTPVRKA